LKTALLFFALTAVADVETTQSCLRRETCVEVSPLFPEDRWAGYGVKAGMGLGLWWLSEQINTPAALYIVAVEQGVVAIWNLQF